MKEVIKTLIKAMTLGALFVSVCSAASFDQSVEAPRIATGQALQTRLKSHFETVNRKAAEGPGAFIRDRAAYKRWLDLYFAVIHAMDEGKPLGDLSAFGLMRNPDGTYTVDLKKFPQWAPLDSRVRIFTNPDVLEFYTPVLKARGFRDVDINAVRTYAATHDPRQVNLDESRELAATFAKHLQQRRQIGQRADLNEVLAYRYQRVSVRREVERQWAVGLLDSLDGQRRRILAAFFEELDSKDTFGLPSEPLNQSLEREAELLTSGAYVQFIEHEQATINAEAQSRAEKMLGGQQQ